LRCDNKEEPKSHFRKRGNMGSRHYIVDVGMAAAQRCTVCKKRFWVGRQPLESCPSCGGKLIATEERRRQAKAGFQTRKECQAAMNKLLVSVEQHTY
jgi:predicted RNA-binding Zn-ribbon protein involved in translation (DUF1610 family)